MGVCVILHALFEGNTNGILECVFIAFLRMWIFTFYAAITKTCLPYEGMATRASDRNDHNWSVSCIPKLDSTLVVIGNLRKFIFI